MNLAHLLRAPFVGDIIVCEKNSIDMRIAYERGSSFSVFGAKFIVGLFLIRILSMKTISLVPNKTILVRFYQKRRRVCQQSFRRIDKNVNLCRDSEGLL